MLRRIAHRLTRSRWNASRAFASYVDSNTSLVHGRNVLELGAGGGLPGIVAAKIGAALVRWRLRNNALVRF